MNEFDKYLKEAIQKAEKADHQREMRNIKAQIKRSIKAIENCLNFDIFL